MATPQNPEQIEKIRQEIMRFRELLDVLRSRVDDGDKLYRRIFAQLSEDDTRGKAEKDVQTLAAYALEADVSPLADAVLHMRFVAYEFDRAFEELYDIILTPPIDD